MKETRSNHILDLARALDRGRRTFERIRADLEDPGAPGASTAVRAPGENGMNDMPGASTADSAPGENGMNDMPGTSTADGAPGEPGTNDTPGASGASGASAAAEASETIAAAEASETPGEAQNTGTWPAFAVEEVYGQRQESGDPRAYDRIAAGDNLDYMVWLLKEKGMAGRIQLIYVDPPFFTGAKYLASVQISGSDGSKSPVLKVGAYEDRWGQDLVAYLEMLAVRFYLMRELLADTGSLWVHLDWHGSHYVKMMLDEIFGEDRFVNEVIWTYKSGGASKRSFARKHDTLLFYSKTKDVKFRPLQEKSYNRGYRPYRFKGVREYEDELGWYTMVNMKDVWSIDMVGRTSSERMGYATQKPEKLLERIVDACTDPGDLCADFFAGTGTLGAVCSRRGRPWILCDSGDVAISSQILRMGRIRDQEEMEGSGADPALRSRRPFLVERPVRPYELKPRTLVQVSLEETVSDAGASEPAGPLSGRRIRLTRCQPDLTQVQIRDRQVVTEFIAANSLDLVSFWTVDDRYDGRVHRARRLLTEETEMVLEQEESDPVSVVGYDLFGGRFQWVSGRMSERKGEENI